MVMPYAHLDRLAVLPTETAHELMDLAQRTERVLDRVYKPHGFNFGMNVGTGSGRGRGRASASACHAAMDWRHQLHDHGGRDARLCRRIWRRPGSGCGRRSEKCRDRGIKPPQRRKTVRRGPGPGTWDRVSKDMRFEGLIRDRQERPVHCSHCICMMIWPGRGQRGTNEEIANNLRWIGDDVECRDRDGRGCDGNLDGSGEDPGRTSIQTDVHL